MPEIPKFSGRSFNPSFHFKMAASTVAEMALQDRQDTATSPLAPLGDDDFDDEDGIQGRDAELLASHFIKRFFRNLNRTNEPSKWQPHLKVVEHRSYSFSYSPMLRRVTATSEPSAANRSSLSRRKRLSEMFRSFSLGKRSSVDSSDSSEKRSVGKSGEY